MASTAAWKLSRSISSMVSRIFSMSDCITVETTSWLPMMSLVTSMRWIEVSLFRIISCRAFCMAGYPSYFSSEAKRTTVDSLT